MYSQYFKQLLLRQRKPWIVSILNCDDISSYEPVHMLGNTCRAVCSDITVPYDSCIMTACISLYYELLPI